MRTAANKGAAEEAAEEQSLTGCCANGADSAIKMGVCSDLSAGLVVACACERACVTGLRCVCVCVWWWEGVGAGAKTHSRPTPPPAPIRAKRQKKGNLKLIIYTDYDIIC